MITLQITEDESRLLCAMLGTYIDDVNEMALGEWKDEAELGGLPRRYASPEVAADALQELRIRLAGGGVGPEVPPPPPPGGRLIERAPDARDVQPISYEQAAGRVERPEPTPAYRPPTNLDELLAKRLSGRPPAPEPPRPGPPAREEDDED